MKALLFAAALLSAAPAVAQETAQSFDWTGFYAGISAGSGKYTGVVAIKGEGARAVHLSILRDNGSFVYGGEISYQRDTLFTVFATKMATVKGIVGYSFGNALVYANAGVSRFTIVQAAPATDNTFAYGVGARYAVTDRVSVGLENNRMSKNDFAGAGARLQTDIWSLRVDYRF